MIVKQKQCVAIVLVTKSGTKSNTVAICDSDKTALEYINNHQLQKSLKGTGMRIEREYRPFYTSVPDTPAPPSISFSNIIHISGNRLAS